MASPEFVAFRERMAAMPPPPPSSLPEQRARIDAAMSQIPLAPGTSATEVDAGGVPAILCERDGGTDDPVLVYFHGGGYRIASALAYRAFGSHVASACDARVQLVDYRLAPEHPVQAAVDDAVAAYGWALANLAPAPRVVIGGDSAGGGLTAALLLTSGSRGLPAPAGAICLSPWVDLRNTAASYDSQASVDTMWSKSSATEAAALYLAGHDPADPLASPVLGDWSGMPPLLVLVGELETLIDDASELAAVARAAGVDVEHDVYPEMPHVWQLNYPQFPEAVAAVEQIGAFVRRVTET